MLNPILIKREEDEVTVKEETEKKATAHPPQQELLPQEIERKTAELLAMQAQFQERHRMSFVELYLKHVCDKGYQAPASYCAEQLGLSKTTIYSDLHKFQGSENFRVAYDLALQIYNLREQKRQQDNQDNQRRILTSMLRPVPVPAAVPAPIPASRIPPAYLPLLAHQTRNAKLKEAIKISEVRLERLKRALEEEETRTRPKPGQK